MDIGVTDVQVWGIPGSTRLWRVETYLDPESLGFLDYRVQLSIGSAADFG